MDLAEDAFQDAQDFITHSDTEGSAAISGSGSIKHTEVFVGGLPGEAKADDVIRRFGEFGGLAEVRLRVDSEGREFLFVG